MNKTSNLLSLFFSVCGKKKSERERESHTARKEGEKEKKQIKSETFTLPFLLFSSPFP